MRASTAQMVNVEVGHGGHILKRHAPKQPTKVVIKKRRIPQFTAVEMRETAVLQQWVEEQFRNVLGG